MARQPMTLKQWRARLGEALPLGEAAAAIGLPVRDLARDARLGRVPVYSFHARDGRVFHMVRVPELLEYHRRRAEAARLTPRMLGRALARMAGAG